jgi:hypothetical protein
MSVIVNGAMFARVKTLAADSSVPSMYATIMYSIVIKATDFVDIDMVDRLVRKIIRMISGSCASLGSVAQLGRTVPFFLPSHGP